MEEEDETKYCSLVDKIFQNYPDVGKALTDNCLSGAVARKSFIMPNTIKGITKDTLMQYILYKPYTIEFLQKMDGKYIKSISGHRFVIKTDGTKVELNGVEIKREMFVGPELHKHELFSITGELVTLPPQSAEEKEAYKKMKENGGSKKKNTKSKKKNKKVSCKGGECGGCATCGGENDDDGSDEEDMSGNKKKYKSFLEVLDSDNEGGEVNDKKKINSLVF